MLAIGQGLTGRPRLLLDESSLGLALLVLRSVLEMVETLNRRGTTIPLVGQNVRRALGLCHRGYVVEKGAVTLVGSREKLLRSDHVRRAYLGM